MPVNVFDLVGVDFGLPPNLGLSLARQRPADYQTPQQTQSLLQQAMGLGVGGISTVANLLDTIGGPIRTALAGNWGDVLPSIYDPASRTGGRELGESWGLLDQNNPGFHPIDDPWDALQDVGGFALEVATDPLTYATFGASAVGKAGKVAKAAGLLDDLARIAPNLGRREARLTHSLDDLLKPRVSETMADQLARLTRAEDAAKGLGYNLDEISDQTLGGLVGTPFGAFGTGDTAKTLARGLDTVGSWMRYGNIPGTNISPGRTLGALFSPEAGDAGSRFGQETLMPAIHGAREAARDTARGQVAEATGNLMRAPEGLRADTLDAKQELRRLLEGVNQPNTPQVTKLVDQIRATEDSFIDEAAEWGTSRRLVDPEAKHLARFLSGKAETLPEGAAPRVVSTVDRSARARREFTVGVKGGTDTLMRIARDPDILAVHATQGLAKKQKAVAIAKIIRDKFPEVPAEYAPRALQVKGQPPVLADRITDLARWYTKMPHKNLEEGIYGNAPLADYAVSRLTGMDKLASTKTILQTLGDNELVAKMWKQSSTPGEGVTLSRLLGNPKEGGLGLNRKAAFTKILELRGMPGAGVKQRKALGRELVPKDLADDITRYVKGFDGPEAAKGLVKALDVYNSLFRTGVTTVFPAFHARNFVSGAFNNWVKGLLPSSPAAAYKVMKEAKTIVEGGAVDVGDIPIVARMLTDRGLQNTPANATDMLRELAFAHEAATRHVDQTAGMSSFEDLTGQFAGGYSGTEPFSKTDALKKYAMVHPDVTVNPFDIRGVGGRTKSGFGPAQAGEDIAYATDAINRLAGFITGLRKGINPRKVAEDVDAAQVAYQARNYTQFEQQWLTRLFPFYKYCVPTDHHILTKQGWKHVDDLVIGESVMAMNPANGIMEWTPLLAVNRFQHDGPMLTMTKKKGDHVTFHCTEGHRWLVRRKRTRGDFDSFELAANIAKKQYAFWQVPTNGEFTGPRKSLLSPRLAAILGWVLTDGHCRWRPVVNGKVASLDHGRDGGGCEMVVYQSPAKHLKKIIELLGTKPRDPHPDSGVVSVPVAIEDRRELLKHFSCDGDLPGICCRLSREAAEAMWQAMFDAEGSMLAGRQGSFEQHANTAVKDAFQILCILTGRSGNIHKQGVYIKKRQHYDATFTRTWFTGEVWCPTTKHGTWMMRHNGCHVVTGNSRAALPFMLEELTERPGGKLAQFLRAQSGARGEEPGTPEYIRETASIKIDEEEDGTDRYLTGFGLGYEDPLSFAGGGLRGALLESASRMTPVAKLPIEWATGESFFQKGPLGGREIDDLDPTLGRTLANILYQTGLRDDPSGEPVQIGPNRSVSQGLEFLLGNSPLSKVASTARTVTDPRKIYDAPKGEGDPLGFLNLMTGLRVADISPAAQDKVIQERADAIMQEMGAKTFTETYFPDEAVAQMGTEDQQRAMQFEALQKLLDRRRRERRQQRMLQAGGI